MAFSDYLNSNLQREFTSGSNNSKVRKERIDTLVNNLSSVRPGGGTDTPSELEKAVKSVQDLMNRVSAINPGQAGNYKPRIDLLEDIKSSRDWRTFRKTGTDEEKQRAYLKFFLNRIEDRYLSAFIRVVNIRSQVAKISSNRQLDIMSITPPSLDQIYKAGIYDETTPLSTINNFVQRVNEFADTKNLYGFMLSNDVTRKNTTKEFITEDATNKSRPTIYDYADTKNTLKWGSGLSFYEFTYAKFARFLTKNGSLYTATIDILNEFVKLNMLGLSVVYDFLVYIDWKKYIDQGSDVTVALASNPEMILMDFADFLRSSGQTSMLIKLKDASKVFINSPGHSSIAQPVYSSL